MDGHMLSYCINFYPEICSYLSSIYLSYLHPVILFALSLSNPPSSKRSLPFPVVPRCSHSLLSDSLSLSLSPPLLFLHWRRRLGERRRHMSRLRPALCRRRASTRYARPPSLSFCCARRSTPNPNKTYLYSDLSPVTVYYLLTSISFAKIIRCTFVYTHVQC